MHCFCGSLNFQRLVNWWLLIIFSVCSSSVGRCIYISVCLSIYLSIYLSYFLKPRWGPCPFCVPAQSLQSCLTLCDPMDCTLPNSSVPGILQARILEWDAKPSSRGSSRLSDQTRISCISFPQADSLPLLHQGNPAHSGSSVNIFGLIA